MCLHSECLIQIEAKISDRLGERNDAARDRHIGSGDLVDFRPCTNGNEFSFFIIHFQFVFTHPLSHIFNTITHATGEGLEVRRNC